MPTYDYLCPKCGAEFQEFQKITAKPVAKCPKCGAKAERQLSAGAGLVFKGSGFYLTDYGRNAHRKTAPETKPEGGGETKKTEKTEKTEKADTASKAEARPAKKKKDD